MSREHQPLVERRKEWSNDIGGAARVLRGADATVARLPGPGLARRATKRRSERRFPTLAEARAWRARGEVGPAARTMRAPNPDHARARRRKRGFAAAKAGIPNALGRDLQALGDSGPTNRSCAPGAARASGSYAFPRSRERDPGSRRSPRRRGLSPSSVETRSCPCGRIYRRASRAEVLLTRRSALRFRPQGSDASGSQADRGARPDRGAPRARPGALGDRALRRPSTRRAAGASLVRMSIRSGRDPGRARLGRAGRAGRSEEPRGQAAGAARKAAARAYRRASPAQRRRRGGMLVFGRGEERAFFRRRSSAGAQGVERAAEARADRPARVPPHLRLVHDRGRREREGALDLHGALEHHRHARPLRASDARQRAEAAGMLTATWKASPHSGRRNPLCSVQSRLRTQWG